MHLRIISTVLFVLTLVLGCSHLDENENDIEESTATEHSHNTGKNCSSCHNSNGNEASSLWWTVAGSVYNSNNKPVNNVSIELRDNKNRTGNLIKQITSDLSGNFYTNQIVNFKNGLYPVIVSGNTVKTMQSPFNGGSCNSCHNGISTANLKIN
jgi:hypothetical protein